MGHGIDCMLQPLRVVECSYVVSISECCGRRDSHQAALCLGPRTVALVSVVVIIQFL
jgi:hypothetical protein